VPAFAGYLSVGCMKGGVFVAATGYTRPHVRFRGHPSIDAVPQVVGASEPVGMVLSHGAIYDHITGGEPLITWPWLPPFQEVRCDFRPLDVSVSLAFYLSLAIAASRTGKPVDCAMSQGETLGTINGQSITPATRLSVADGGLVLGGAVKSMKMRTKKPEGSFPATDRY
jgi:hypothetical protein